MSALRDLTVWLPALEAQLRNAPPGVDLVEYTGTVGQGSMAGSHRMDGNSPNRGLSGHDWSEELFALAKQYDIDCVGVVLRSSRSGIREVDLIELPGCVTSLPGGGIVGTLVLHDGALPALYRRRPDPTVAAGPAHSADPAALARLVAQKIPDATPATPEQLAEWRVLLDVGQVPSQLLAAGIGGGDQDVAAAVGTANELLQLWGRPLIETARLRQ
ncbi:hypothetical protein H7J71_20115 [Mycolicibacterium peregrinum]|uniref:hypothetical protein n=1 Tax=Mycolicibacterium peregrinum TaxID=43304 RepID=UPI0006D7B16B|nr:hypothetical protein [Mycolicibacterium peregrinum]MCV7204319.1 hypothetical protein [Mycolicibacterium peregrinum]ORW55674.1 hypothetical protein AWC21_21470 [Mycolicibacterium peregrinum]